MHVNIKPLDQTRVYETPAQAIEHLFIFGVWSKQWRCGVSFGQSIAMRRAIDAAIKERDAAAFKAAKRRGYWRVELAR